MVKRLRLLGKLLVDQDGVCVYVTGMNSCTFPCERKRRKMMCPFSRFNPRKKGRVGEG